MSDVGMTYNYDKFRLYPTRAQEEAFEQTLETCRRLFNELLDDRIKNHTTRFEQNHTISVRRKKDKFLGRVHSQVLQNVAFRLERAVQAFFAGTARYPKFKRKHRYNSFTYPQMCSGGFGLIGQHLRLSLIGDVKIKLHRDIDGAAKTCTIIRDVDRWYACLAVMVEAKELPIATRPPVGVDLGISPIIALSDGTVVASPRFLKQSVDKIKSLQKSMFRKKEGSKNRTKARTRLAKAWRKVRNRRNDFVHKQSRYLADNYGTVVFESLAVMNMTKNHSLASAILDSCWGKLRRLTAYKVERRGGREILVEPRGSSQECSGCRKTVPKDLSERVHRCPYCGLVLERNVNAARVILARGLEQAHAEAEPLPARGEGKFSSMKQEARNINFR